MIIIRRESLDKFWIWETVTVRGNLTMLKKLVIMAKSGLGLENWFTLMGTIP